MFIQFKDMFFNNGPANSSLRGIGLIYLISFAVPWSSILNLSFLLVESPDPLLIGKAKDQLLSQLRG